MKRRRFIALLALGSLAALWARFRHSARRWFPFGQADGSVDFSEPVGELDDATLQTLLAVPEAFYGSGIEKYNYELYFTWRAEFRPGYRKLFELFSQELNDRALDEFTADFLSCNLVERNKILQDFMPAQGFAKLRRPLLGRANYDQFYRQIIVKQQRIFLRTDAWLMAGYDQAPAQARGLEKYGRPQVRLQKSAPAG